jgi:hypothetical protein
MTPSSMSVVRHVGVRRRVSTSLQFHCIIESLRGRNVSADVAVQTAVKVFTYNHSAARRSAVVWPRIELTF